MGLKIFNKPLNKDVNKNATSIAKIEDSMAYRLGETNTTGATLAVGTYVYISGNSTLTEGMYTISTAVAVDGTLSSSNCTSVSGGIANALSSNLTASSVTVTPNSTYIFSTQISCVKNNYIANLSGWFNANANIPSNGTTILSNLPIRSYLYGANMKVLLVNQTTGVVYHCLIDDNGNLKTDYNRENIPSGEYRIISCMYLLK